MPLPERMVGPVCVGCPGNVDPLSFYFFWQVGPLGGTHQPLVTGGMIESRFPVCAVGVKVA